MPRKRNADKVSSQTTTQKGSQTMRKTKGKAKNKKIANVCKKSKEPMSRNLESDVLTQMKEKGYNGKQFIDHLKAGVQDRLNKRGKPPRMKKNVGPSNANYAYPPLVLEFIRDIAPGDIKGEIKEDAYPVQMIEFCEALKIPMFNNSLTED